MSAMSSPVRNALQDSASTCECVSVERAYRTCRLGRIARYSQCRASQDSEVGACVHAIQVFGTLLLGRRYSKEISTVHVSCICSAFACAHRMSSETCFPVLRRARPEQ